MTIYGIDIANFQDGLDLSRVKAEGFDFVWAKVSEGSGFKDHTWPGFRDAAKANGLLLAGYHYVRGDADADAQADTFVSQLGDNSIPAMLDFEANSGDMSTFWAVLNAIEARGVKVRLSYIPHWYWQQIGSPDISQVPGLIQSSYVNGSGAASALYPGDGSSNWNGFGGKSVDVLQFTDQASVAGFSVDANAFAGTREQLAALLGGTQSAVIPGGEMQLTDKITDAYGNEVTVADALKWALYHGDLVLDQFGGPDTRKDLPAQFAGWPQLGNKTVVDALADIRDRLTAIESKLK